MTEFHTLIAELREAVGRADNNKINRVTLELFELLAAQHEKPSIPWSAITDKPTTLAGFGINDATWRDPLDHDGDGKKGGPIPKRLRKTKDTE